MDDEKNVNSILWYGIVYASFGGGWEFSIGKFHAMIPTQIATFFMQFCLALEYLPFWNSFNLCDKLIWY